MANLTTFRSNLLSHVWSSFNPAAPFPQVCQDTLPPIFAYSNSQTLFSMCGELTQTMRHVSKPAKVCYQTKTTDTHVSCCVQGFKRFDPLRPFIHCPPHRPLIRYGNAAGDDLVVFTWSMIQCAPPACPPCTGSSCCSNVIKCNQG